MMLLKSSHVAVLLLMVISPAILQATEKGADLGRQNYILNCQGCHLPDASGSKGLVPRIRDFSGYFLHVDGGREFIVQVPGSANAPLSDQELADVLNWMLNEFSAGQLPENFSPYSAEEVARLRSEPLVDVISTREALIMRIRDELGVSDDGLGDHPS